MKYYINTNKDIFGIEQGQESLVQADWSEITTEEIAELQKPTEAEIQAQKVQEAKAYLASTDWIVTKINEAQIKGEAISDLLLKYAEELQKREEARLLVNELGGN